MSIVLNKMAKNAYTENGALSYSTTGTGKYAECLNYWSKAGTYRLRSQDAVNLDMSRIYGDDHEAALKIIFGLRLITRKPNNTEINDVQSGYGLRDEFYKAIVWMHKYHSDTLYRNLHLIPVFGSWKDFLNEPLLSTLSREKVYELFAKNLENDLLVKYLPQPRTKSKQRTDRDKVRSNWAKGFISYLGITEKNYRKLKAHGAAHVWQRQMGQRQWDSINFNGIPGKAMLLHTSRKGKDQKTVFERHGQVERLLKWVSKQKTIKFTGYPYELTQAAMKSNGNIVQEYIYNKQFEKLLEPLKGHKLGNVWAALDTSGSMSSHVIPGVSAYDICISMGLVFSSLNVGHFKDNVVAFCHSSSLISLKGTFCERLRQIRSMTTAWGSTNFQSVIDLLVQVRLENPTIPLSEYPETILVVSDMQFNTVGCSQTNYERAMQQLRSVGLNDVRIIWWWVTGRGTDFPSQMDDKGVYMIGGFDATNLRALMGLSNDPDKKEFVAQEKKEQTPLDGMMNWLSQPIFSLIQ